MPSTHKFKALKSLKNLLNDDTSSSYNLIDSFIALQDAEHIDKNIKIKELVAKSFETLDSSILDNIDITYNSNTADFLAQWNKTVPQIDSLYTEGERLINDLYDYYELSVQPSTAIEGIEDILSDLAIEIAPKVDITELVIKDPDYLKWQKKLENLL